MKMGQTSGCCSPNDKRPTPPKPDENITVNIPDPVATPNVDNAAALEVEKKYEKELGESREQLAAARSELDRL